MPKIMIVDDNPDIVLVVENILKGAGHEVIGATSGAEAIELLNDAKVDLILLDIMMPELDGWETLKRIRSLKGHSNTFVSMLTAKILTPNITGGEDVLELVDYIQKPFSKEGLIKRVNNILGDSAVNLGNEKVSALSGIDGREYQKILRLEKLHVGMRNTLRENLEKVSDKRERQSIKEALEYQEKIIKDILVTKKELTGGIL